MPSNRSSDRWGNTAVAGAAIAAGGAGMVMHGADAHTRATERVALHGRDLEAAESRLRDVKIRRDTGEQLPGKQTWAGKVKHAEGRIQQATVLRSQAKERLAGAKRVKRIGSGVLGAGATLGALGAVMAERRRKQAPKVSSRIATPHEAPPSDRPLKDYRSMVSRGGLLQDAQGKPKGISPTAGRDWLRANKDRA